MKTFLTVTAVSLLAALSMQADVITKGGSTALVSTPVTKGVPASSHEGCGMCKSEFSTRTSVAPKGTAPVTTLQERHLCPSCVTKISTTGSGKAKAEVAVHSCGGCKS